MVSGETITILMFFGTRIIGINVFEWFLGHATIWFNSQGTNWSNDEMLSMYLNALPHKKLSLIQWGRFHVKNAI